MKFAHIAPTAYIEPLNLHRDPCQLLLAHLVESDTNYVRIYEDSKANREITILDNSGYELYREGKPMFDPEKMVELGKEVGADYLVLPDHPGHHSSKTISNGLDYAEKFKSAGYGTFFVPQSAIGDLEDYLTCCSFAATNPSIDYIGISILGCPNAYGVDKNPYQQLLARVSIFMELSKRGILQIAKANNKKIHCLGMTDGPKEISFLADFIARGYIDTWDSSAAVWAGINDVAFDNTPTGLENGKIQSAVDFDLPLDKSKLELATGNINYINDLVKYANRLSI